MALEGRASIAGGGEWYGQSERCPKRSPGERPIKGPPSGPAVCMQLCHLISGHPKGLVDARSHHTHLLAQAPRQDDHTTDCPALGSPADPGPYSQPRLSSSPFKHHSKERDPGTQSHRSCSRTLTLIMLQEPVSPHVPHLHSVVHAGSSNTRAAGVEVYIGDEAGKTGAPTCCRKSALAQDRPQDTQHRPTPAPVLTLSLSPECLPPTLFLYQMAKGEQGEDESSDYHDPGGFPRGQVPASTSTY